MTNDLESNPFLKQEERNALENCRSFAFHSILFTRIEYIIKHNNSNNNYFNNCRWDLEYSVFLDNTIGG